MLYKTDLQKLQTAPLRKDRDIYQKNALESYLFINNDKKGTEDYKESFSYGLRSGRNPPQVKNLIQFEDDLVRIVKELNLAK